MSFEQALVIELSMIPAISGKVFPLSATEGETAPYAAYGSSEGLKDKTLGGYIANKTINVEVNVVAKSYSELKQIASLTLEKIISFQSRTIGIEGLYVQDLTYSQPLEFYEDLPGLYRTLIPFQIYL